VCACACSDVLNNDSLKCFVHVLDAEHYCRRINTIEDYIAANQDV
jgi:hypothetical protein